MKKENHNIINVIYVGAFIALFVGLLAFVLISVLKPFDYKKIERVKHTKIEECLNENTNAKGTQSKYYLLVYSKDDKDNENIEKQVLEYANYVKHHATQKDIVPLYLLAYNESDIDTLKTISTSIEDVESMPIMFIVDGNKVTSTKYETCSKINKALYDALTKLKEAEK